VLSVRQPWATELVLGLKPIEFRSWNTQHRGPLWIHASRWEGGYRQDYREELGDELDELYPTGAIIGWAQLLDVVGPTLSQSEWRRKVRQIFQAAGRWDDVDHKFISDVIRCHEPIDELYCWLMLGGERLDVPLPAGGKLRLWQIKLPK
jgi:hypothetical protein